MGKIILDRRGDMRKGIFYQFHVPFDDDTDGLRSERDWIVVARTPTDNALRIKGDEPYLWISPWTSDMDCVETKDCPADPHHLTHQYSRNKFAEAFGGKRDSPFIPMNVSAEFAVSDDLHLRLEKLKLRGMYLNEFDLKEHGSEKRLRGFWSFQFVGKAKLRPPKLVDAPNSCPLCGKSPLICEGCGQCNPACAACGKSVWTVESKHGGKDDKRLPFEPGCFDGILEGKTWDGSDLVQASGGWTMFASKRFIDWLLRVHAAPFYAEPVLFAVDGMNAEQQQWLKELDKPLES